MTVFIVVRDGGIGLSIVRLDENNSEADQS